MKVALHICCAVCAGAAAERLVSEGHQIVGFFYNPNIYPPEEYLRRREAASRVAHGLGFPLVEGDYRPGEWRGAVSGLENEPEGGKRCPLCFAFRLEKTYRFMLEQDCEAFTTTLTMGSNKSAQLISQIGRKIGGDTFLPCDFKKKEGFKRALALARRWELYRQHYCGCEFSLAGRAFPEEKRLQA